MVREGMRKHRAGAGAFAWGNTSRPQMVKSGIIARNDNISQRSAAVAVAQP